MIGRYHRIIGSILLVTLAVLVGCSSGEATPPPITRPAETAAAQSALVPSLPLNEDGFPVVARVNDEYITQDEFDRALARSSELGQTTSYDAFAELVLTTLIQQKLINQAAIEMGITVTEDEISTEIAALRALVPNDNDWQAWLIENRFRDEAEYRIITRDSLLTQKVQAQVIQPTQGEVTEIRARHILVDEEGLAQSLATLLQNGDAEFGQMAAEYSKDVTTREQGGDLGWFTADVLIVPQLADFALSLPLNTVSDPFLTELGYHIIEVQETRTRAASDSESVQDSQNQFESWLSDQYQNATIERYLN
ncbi:MAG: peptidylprolyl isomerase [Anaerolineae bacterium]|nr:peptidylprolyl isomerase [Anaerolineae bacterium]